MYIHVMFNCMYMHKITKLQNICLQQEGTSIVIGAPLSVLTAIESWLHPLLPDWLLIINIHSNYNEWWHTHFLNKSRSGVGSLLFFGSVGSCNGVEEGERDLPAVLVSLFLRFWEDECSPLMYIEKPASLFSRQTCSGFFCRKCLSFLIIKYP